MANTSISLVGLDFESIKTNLKSYLRTNTQFKDLDFEGSNLSVLVDLLAYNTYLNSYYTNMVGSEMFLDSAQLRDSVVSHAKELNYTPRSCVSAQANVTISVVPATAVTSVVIPRYTTMSARLGTDVFSFSTDEALIASTTDGVTYTATTNVFEGEIVNDTFVVSGETDQRFVCSNPTIDTRRLDVTVYEDSGQTTLTYMQAHTLIGVSALSQVFFVQAAESGQYEIVFGDGVFGRRPKAGSTVVVAYRATSGELPNGSSTFTPDGTIDGHTNVTVTVNTAATGGAVAESLESIRFNAPRSFATQDRAVTARDYEVLLKSRFPEIQAISVYGGEEHDPPQYGRVFISADVYGAEGAPVFAQQQFIDYIKDKTPLTIVPEFIAPTFLHVQVNATVHYDITATTKTTNDIQAAVTAAISQYTSTNLNDFNTTLYYSQLIRVIDDADASIIDNDTEIVAIKEYHPNFGVKETVSIDLGAVLAQEPGILTVGGDLHYGHTITSTKFKSFNQTCIIVDDGQGVLYLVAAVGDLYEPIASIGTVDYQHGKIVIESITVQELIEGDYVKVYMRTLSKNIAARRNTLLTISMDDVNVTVQGVKPL
jgi:Baseplate J-like protein